MGSTSVFRSRSWPYICMRCSGYTSCLCVVMVASIYLCPPYAFGMTRYEVAAGLGAIETYAILLSLVNAVFSASLMVVSADLRESRWLWILYIGVVLPFFVIFFTPAIAIA